VFAAPDKSGNGTNHNLPVHFSNRKRSLINPDDLAGA
jgi:hypothetical protein